MFPDASTISSAPDSATQSVDPTAHWLNGLPSNPTVRTTCSDFGSIAVTVRPVAFNTQINSPPAVTLVGVNVSGTSPTTRPDLESTAATEFAAR